MRLKDDLVKEFENMREKMRKWLEYSSQYRVASCCSGEVSWIPAADIHETEKAYHIFVDLAGVDPSSVELMIEGRVLRLTGERRRPRVEDCSCVHQLEIDFGAFRRLFQFPRSLDPDGAESSIVLASTM